MESINTIYLFDQVTWSRGYATPPAQPLLIYLQFKETSKASFTYLTQVKQQSGSGHPSLFLPH